MRSEEALDSALAAIEARLNHETNSVATEKKLIADLKKLESQREKARALLPPAARDERVGRLDRSAGT